MSDVFGLGSPVEVGEVEEPLALEETGFWMVVGSVKVPVERRMVVN